MWLSRKLGIDGQASLLVQGAILTYLAHILCQGWIASSEGFLFISMALLLAAIYRGEIEPRFHVLYFPLALFVIASFASAIASPHPIRAIRDTSEWYTFLGFPLALTLYRAVPRARMLATNAFLILLTFLSSYGIYQYFFRGFYRSLDYRITGTTAHVMTYSGILLPTSLLALALVVHRMRPLALIAMLAGTTALVLTFTRGAWIGWIAGVFVLVLIRKARLTGWVALLLFVAILFSPLTIFSRLISSVDLQQSSNLDRVRMIEAGLEMIDDYPLLGVGPSHVKPLYPLYRKADAPRFNIPHLHNNVIHIWAERGALALIAYLLLILMFVRECLRVPGPLRRRSAATGGLVIATAMTVAGLFEYNFGDTEVLLTMLDLFALCCGYLEAENGTEAVTAES